MSVKIPNPYDWNKEFEVLYQRIDDEHKGLFAAVKKCESLSVDDLKACAKACTDHFEYEEGQMKGNNYPDFKPHKAKHDAFLQEVGGIITANKVTDDNVTYLKKWLCEHIIQVDFNYKGKLGKP